MSSRAETPVWFKEHNITYIKNVIHSPESNGPEGYPNVKGKYYVRL
jgi:hypothetical protein